jgi:hypothetical protein
MRTRSSIAALAGPGALRAEMVVKFLRASRVASTNLLNAVLEKVVVTLADDMGSENFSCQTLKSRGDF